MNNCKGDTASDRHDFASIINAALSHSSCQRFLFGASMGQQAAAHCDKAAVPLLEQCFGVISLTRNLKQIENEMIS
jgi:hypothetical protein